MHSYANRYRLLACAVAVVLAAVSTRGVLAQDSQAGTLFEDARTLEVALRKEIGTYRSGTPSMPLIRRARILIGTYEDIARLFPDGGYGDKSLWQGASLAADVFDVFQDAADRASAVRLTELLGSRYPMSAFVAQAHRRIESLALPPPSSAGTTATPDASPSPAPSPRPTAAAPPAAATASRATSTPSTSTVLQSIRREVLPDVLRVTIQLDKEVVFHDERIDGPPRVFVDLQNTRASADVQDARLSFDDDVVRQIRVGRQLDRRTRVVLDLSDAPRHSVYTLYDPFRIVVDFERTRPDVPLASTSADNDATASRAATSGARTTADTPGGARSTPAPSPAPSAARPAVPPAAKAAPSMAADVKATVSAPPAPKPATPQVAAAARPEPVLTAPPPARTPGGLSIARQLGLGITRVVIDPGHGGHDPGAKQGALTEAELVLDVALRVELLLQKENIEVVLTRRSNEFVPLEERPAMAMREEADIYLSIHANASSDARVRGVETYVLNFAQNAQSSAVAARENTGSSRTMRSLPDIVKTIAFNNKIDESRDLARQVQTALIEKLSRKDRAVRNLGVKQAPFVVLVGADMPSILAEIGFITNKQDAALVKTAVYRQQIAEALVSGILSYQKRLKPAQVAAAGSR